MLIKFLDSKFCGYIENLTFDIMDDKYLGKIFFPYTLFMVAYFCYNKLWFEAVGFISILLFAALVLTGRIKLDKKRLAAHGK